MVSGYTLKELARIATDIKAGLPVSNSDASVLEGFLKTKFRYAYSNSRSGVSNERNVFGSEILEYRGWMMNNRYEHDGSEIDGSFLCGYCEFGYPFYTLKLIKESK